MGAQGAGLPADDVTSFSLGSIPVSPMSMAAAYASVAARGRYCAPDPLVRIVTSTGTYIKLTPDSCHQIMPRAVADAANYILRGVLYNGYGTANMRGIGRPLSSAAKTGTANGGYFAAFAGYTRSLAGYVSVFNPTAPTTYGAMVGPRACFRDLGNNYPSCDGQMYGWMAPGATWEYTFLRAAIGPDIPFVGVPGNSPYFNEGYGDAGPKTCNPPKKPRHGAPPTPTPPPTSATTC